MCRHTPCACPHVVIALTTCCVKKGHVSDSGEEAEQNACRSHMSEFAEGFHPATFILRPSGSFSACRGPQLRDDLRNG